MANGKNLTNWSDIDSADAYRLSQAEFKGMAIQALQDLKEDVNEIKRQNEVRGYINYLISGFVGLIGGLFGVNLHR